MTTHKQQGCGAAMPLEKERWFIWYSQQLEHFIYEKGFTEEDLMAHLTNALTNTTSSEAATHQDATTEEEKEINNAEYY